jgi:hypothetical protein
MPRWFFSPSGAFYPSVLGRFGLVERDGVQDLEICPVDRQVNVSRGCIYGVLPLLMIRLEEPLSRDDYNPNRWSTCLNDVD